MEKTINDKEWLLMNKKSTPSYGDIIVIRMDDKTNYIKRVIALGGDTVKTVSGKVFLKKKGESDFTELSEPYARYDGKEGTFDVNGNDFSVTVNDGYVFFLGDNRNKSTDSRVRGARPISDVIGVVSQNALKYQKYYGWYYEFVYRVNTKFFRISYGT